MPLARTTLVVVLTLAAPAAAAQDLGHAVVTSIDGSPPALAGASSGAAVAVTASRGGLRLWRAPVGRAFGGARLLTPAGSSPVLAMDPTGGLAFAYVRGDGSHVAADPYDEDCCARLHAGIVSPDGRRSPVRRLSARGDHAGTAVVGTRGGRGAVAWTDSLGLRVSAGTASRGFGPRADWAPACRPSPSSPSAVHT